MINYLTKTIVVNKIGEFDKNYNIVCCTDEKFLRALGVLLISILENNTGNFAFHIFYRGNLSIENEQKLRQIAYSYKISLIVYCIDDSQFTTLHTTDVINLVTYYRFIAPYILADLNIAKILYLDVDMLCVGDIKKLFDIELKDNIAYTVKDPTDIAMKKYCESIGADSDNYFNAGMLLINVQRYVEEDIGQKAICLLKKKKYYFMDQDVLNILMKNKVIADIKIDYNCTMSTRNNAFKNNKNKPKLIHFTMSRKPWKIYTSMWGGRRFAADDDYSWKYSYYKLWREYNKKSPWKDIPFDKPQNYTEWRYLAEMYKKVGKYNSAVKAYFKYIKSKYFKEQS